MADLRLTGGGNEFALFPIDATHGTVGAVALTGNSNIKPDIGDTQITIDQAKADASIYDLLNVQAFSVAEAASATEVETLTFDDSSTVSGTAGSASSKQQYIGYVLGATQGSNIKVTLFCCTINPASGNHSQEAGKFERPNITLDLVDALQDITFSVAASILPADFDSAATADLLTGKAKAVKFLAAA